jgi:hypothetical protein
MAATSGGACCRGPPARRGLRTILPARYPAASLVTFSIVFQTRAVEGEQMVFLLANTQLYRNIMKHLHEGRDEPHLFSL